jgi:hypothetical protein
MKLVLKGKPEYIKHMYKHLRAEHPTTRRRMKLVGGNNYGNRK